MASPTTSATTPDTRPAILKVVQAVVDAAGKTEEFRRASTST
jgi:hypothetical protein